MSSLKVQSVRGALLFVRSADDLLRAVKDVNQLLAHRRTRGSVGDEVLGIVARKRGSSPPLVRAFVGACLADASVEVSESVGLAGIWSLCWFDLTSVRGRQPHDRRKRLLNALLAGRAGGQEFPAEGRVFLPVLTPEESHQEVDVLRDDLRSLYPSLMISADCFVHDAASGGIAALGAGAPRLRLVRSR